MKLVGWVPEFFAISTMNGTVRGTDFWYEILFGPVRGTDFCPNFVLVRCKQKKLWKKL